jgi:hypothetical protein
LVKHIEILKNKLKSLHWDFFIYVK